MARIHIRRPHTLGLSEARAQVERLRAALERDLGARSHWQGDALHFHRPGASGRIAVGADFVDLDLRLGLLLAPLKGGIAQAVHQRLDAVIGPEGKTGPT